MWSVISRVFSRKSSLNKSGIKSPNAMEQQDSYDTRQAKQRASVKWLLSKAYNNKVPENLKEPFYRDHEEQEHLKPQIVHALASAELYCLAMSNIYSDPNYHNLNHSGIIQALIRKGVTIAEPSDAQLTETVLIQTNPIKMSAHMAVMEAVMVLYSKEVATGDRVQAAIQRFSHHSHPVDVTQYEPEQALVAWLNEALSALHQKIQQERDRAGGGDEPKPPEFPAVKDLSDLSDGVALAALVSFYCPEEVPWREIVVSCVPTVSDSVHNLMLVHDFCQRCLPHSLFHMMPEDVSYLRGSMRQNVIVFLADMFNVLEIHPVKCVRFPGSERSQQTLKEAYPRNSHGVAHKRCLPQAVTGIPDLRSSLSDNSSTGFQSSANKSATVIHTGTSSLKRSHAKGSGDSLDDRGDDSFVVHRGRVVPTLSSVGGDEPVAPARSRKERSVEPEEVSSSVPAGRPSNWEDQRRSSYAGRRSRRNSVSDDSQLTLENFGGSHENLHLLGRNPDKEPAVHVGRTFNTNGTHQNGPSNALDEKNDPEKPTERAYKQDVTDGDVLQSTNFAELSRYNNKSRAEDSTLGIHIGYSSEDPPSKTNGIGNSEKKTTTFAALPCTSTTTWRQQTSSHTSSEPSPSSDHTARDSGSGGSNSPAMGSELLTVRLQLEERRRHIESEKRRMDLLVSQQRQKVGRAAFLQAVSKGKNPPAKSPGSDGSKEGSDPPTDGTDEPTPEESAEVKRYQESIAQMNSSLHEIQADLQRLEVQQSAAEQCYQSYQLPPINVPPQYQPQQQMQSLVSQQQMAQHHGYSNTLSQHHLQQLPPQVHSMVNTSNPQGHYGSPLHHQQHQQIQSMVQQNNQFYLHDQQQSQPQPQLQPPPQQQRRTWGPSPPPQQPQPHPQDLRTWGDVSVKSTGSGFTLHQPVRYHNGDQPSRPLGLSSLNAYGSQHQPQHQPQHQLQHQPHHHHHQPPAPFQLHDDVAPTPPPRRTLTSVNASPSHRPSPTIHRSPEMKARQQGHMSEEGNQQRNWNIVHAPLPTPPVDDMEPQSISFIDTPAGEEINPGIGKLQITSGNRTYRIPSPTRLNSNRHPLPQHSLNNSNKGFYMFNNQDEREVEEPEREEPEEAAIPEKGFYISFDEDSTPKRPKPPLRVKRASPKKERGTTQVVDSSALFGDRNEDPHSRLHDKESRSNDHHLSHMDSMRYPNCEETTAHAQAAARLSSEPHAIPSRERAERHAEDDGTPGVGLVIGSDLVNPDPSALDEMEKKKERIMLQSLQRRQQQEEQKARKEMEAHQRREAEKMKEEERARKREEDRIRRQAILEQHKLKKALEEAEREGKTIDKELLNSVKSGPKMRNKPAVRPRPKTIHVDSGNVEMAEGMLTPARGKKGSTSNLAEPSFTPSMRRDYYRGSQDSLADHRPDRRERTGRSYSLVRDSPDDGRGSSPSRSNPLGRRGSYKTSRDVQDSRGRPKYSTYQSNLRARKSNSLMNLCGSSTDQDSMAYRYGDTDSGLGRATPPRRAPSPGMSSGRHLTSPSGPGSLPPGLTTKRRMFDDGSSDVGSATSSMLDYNGPRLYKQPATKSNRGIMLNAVEYCVFPGAVNKEAKGRVLEEISRSEAKHFLILFRDAGCQFRALYSYCPDREEVFKLYGTGPKQVTDRMFDRFFKYNSGGKCFAQVHTKHLTVTIDAFTIHNSLWQGKKVNLPSKKDMALVI